MRLAPRSKEEKAERRQQYVRELWDVALRCYTWGDRATALSIIEVVCRIIKAE